MQVLLIHFCFSHCCSLSSGMSEWRVLWRWCLSMYQWLQRTILPNPRYWPTFFYILIQRNQTGFVKNWNTLYHLFVILYHPGNQAVALGDPNFLSPSSSWPPSGKESAYRRLILIFWSNLSSRLQKSQPFFS